MKVFGLLGKDVSRSFSPELHAFFSPEPYRLFSMNEEEARAFLENGGFEGINVTMPYKKTVIPYLKEITSRAREAGSVNTVIRRPDGGLYGDNTDCAGLSALLDRVVTFSLDGKKVLVLGTGGTGGTARAVLKERGAEPVFISREGENTYADLPRFCDAVGLINTTPVGMSPHRTVSPVNLRSLPGLRFVVDVIYTPVRTALIQQAESLGIPCVGGLRMLVEQAAEARLLFDGARPSAEQTEEAYLALLRKKRNLVLIGMPGCGKTTVGRALAQKLGLPFTDTDEMVERCAGKTIPVIFEERGEKVFRAMEQEAVREATASGGQIIAVGGGAPLSEENRLNLKSTGIVLWLKRSPEMLSSVGRPLSAGGKERLWALSAEREPFYSACADLILSNDTTPEECVRRVEECYYEAFYH